MNGQFIQNALGALSSRYSCELEQASGMSLEQIQTSVEARDEKSLCWLQKQVERVRKENPQLYAQVERMARGNAGGRNPFPGSR
jgi:hypothetical protein